MNSKRGRQFSESKLKAIPLNKKNLKNIEKIILKRVDPKDFYLTFKRNYFLFKEMEYVKSSARFMDDTSYWSSIVINSKSPNVTVTFTKKYTKIECQRFYYKGELLEKIDDSIREIKKYIETQAV